MSITEQREHYGASDRPTPTLLLLGVCTRARAETETRPDLRTKIKYFGAQRMKQQHISQARMGSVDQPMASFLSFFGLLLLFLTSGEEHCAILPYTHALDYSF